MLLIKFNASGKFFVPLKISFKLRFKTFCQNKIPKSPETRENHSLQQKLAIFLNRSIW